MPATISPTHPFPAELEDDVNDRIIMQVGITTMIDETDSEEVTLLRLKNLSHQLSPLLLPYRKQLLRLRRRVCWVTMMIVATWLCQHRWKLSIMMRYVLTNYTFFGFVNSEFPNF